ncbi:MAG: helicase [Clostridia bacterium]|nr:helicase [Clostridia bacterium]MBS3970930.1 helicase [Clostridia bacterium]
MRNKIIDFLKRELIGPDPVLPFIQDNGEEILFEPPRIRYGAGILFPQEVMTETTENVNPSEREYFIQIENTEEDETDNTPELEEGEGSGSIDESNDVNDDIINLSNAFMPSAMGFSCFLVPPQYGLMLEVSAGYYREGEYKTENKEGKIINRKAFFREKIFMKELLQIDEIPNPAMRKKVIPVKNQEGKETGLLIDIRARNHTYQGDNESQLFTFSLVNDKKSSGTIKNEDCFFQVELKVSAVKQDKVFQQYPDKKFPGDVTEDEESMQLLYRNKKTFAVGHGCASNWKESKNGTIEEIRTEVLPVYDLKPILPAHFSDLDLKMYDMSEHGEFSSLINNISALCDKYEEWIDKQDFFTENELDSKYKKTAMRHVINCKKCLARMREGIELIRNDLQVRRSFQLMNEAMLLQQLRFNLKLRSWKVDQGGLKVETLNYPRLEDSSTWPDKKLGSWRPFQIAFILMNLKSIARPESTDREIVDIIWFPTGGGKTEAYLGLTAFTIFLKRLKNKHDDGTTVLMRYTLRLLTSQQYQRAASLICACDLIRQADEENLGKDRIRIGLWVGESLTPNRQTDAVNFYNQLKKGETKENPFIMLKCPWCGVQMGPVKNGKTIEIKGYKKFARPSRVTLQCGNSECNFSKDDFGLPLQVIDEDIYLSPPELIIGTVDKFAILPWKPEARSIFGFRQNRRISPPELIIQDELHLISGPLGSMVGHYETFISELCKSPSGTRPKIIASTATISRAKEQCHALYNCKKENVFQFPPQCIDAGQSFFAYEDKIANGRMYAGVHASGLPSHATTQVRVIGTLLQSIKSIDVKDEKERDYYWTLVNYFNSLRELGHAATLISADIREYLNAMWARKGICKDKEKEIDHRRFINRAIELTSRISNSEVPHALHSLEIKYPPEDDNLPVDVCLATNMISVGVDVPRLGLMTVTGQPKTTSEYIQATSRVGRSKDGPGLVVVIYNVSKPRDRSHYEHFCSYHSRIYSQVEPTSVTPFSSPVRERALHALLVGYVRYFGKNSNTSSPQPFPEAKLLDEFGKILEERIKEIDPAELELTLKLLDYRLDEWKRYLPPKYGDFSPPNEELPLMYAAGSTPHSMWNDKAWPTPTSMRNVDASCEASVIRNYLELEEES